ncbi:MAG TPA: glycosyltransferase family 4 protein [Bryobacteraceae bacterium]|nr:glycosyltransferase family 4 protein [Bryobacteraceae bacterium]
MKANKYARPIPVLLTVPHLNRTASPYRELMAIAKLLPREEFRLTVCSLRDGGWHETKPLLRELGIDCFVARFRPTGRSLRAIRDSWRDQALIDRRGPFAIQHSLDFTSSPFEALMARLQSRVYVYSQRNLNQNGHPVLLRFKTRLAHRVIAISDSVQRFLYSEGVPKRKVTKVYLGIDPTEMTAERKKGYFLCVGQIAPPKGHHQAIRALSQITPQCPEARLGIAGNVFDPAYLQSLKQLALELGVQDRVDFLGPRTDILQLMAQATALVHCSESEAFGWVIVEAMSVGTPVIASASEGPSEIIDHGSSGLLVEPGDVKALADAMQSVMNNPTIAVALSEQGRQAVVRRFSVSAMVDRIGLLYLDCLNEKPAASPLTSAASRNL